MIKTRCNCSSHKPTWSTIYFIYLIIRNCCNISYIYRIAFRQEIIRRMYCCTKLLFELSQLAFMKQTGCICVCKVHVSNAIKTVELPLTNHQLMALKLNIFLHGRVRGLNVFTHNTSPYHHVSIKNSIRIYHVLNIVNLKRKT